MTIDPRVHTLLPWLLVALLPQAVRAWIDPPFAEPALEVWHLGPPDRWWLYTLTWSKRPIVFTALAGLFCATVGLAARATWTGEARARRAPLAVGATLAAAWLTVVATLYPWGPPARHELHRDRAQRYAPALTLEMGAVAGLVLVLLLAVAELRARRARALVETSLVGAVLAWAVLAVHMRGTVFMRWGDTGGWWLEVPLDAIATLSLALALAPLLPAFARARKGSHPERR